MANGRAKIAAAAARAAAAAWRWIIACLARPQVSESHPEFPHPNRFARPGVRLDAWCSATIRKSSISSSRGDESFHRQQQFPPTCQLMFRDRRPRGRE